MEIRAKLERVRQKAEADTPFRMAVWVVVILAFSIIGLVSKQYWMYMSCYASYTTWMISNFRHEQKKIKECENFLHK